MNLFNLLGPRFFSIFSSQNRELYAEALFVLIDSFSPEEPTLRRDTYARKLAERFSLMLQDADFSDDEEYTSSPDIDKVSFIIRKLKETGWIEIAQIENSFSEEIIVPDYAASIIRTLKNVSERKDLELKGRVYSSYSNLKSAESAEEKYLALRNSYENMELFSSELVTIFTNIRGEHQKCMEIDDITDLLSAFLERYQENIVKRFIEPLSTINSAVRYRSDIIRILMEWSYDPNIRETVAKETAKAEGIGEEEAEHLTLSRIDSIITGYDSQISLINSIFDKNNKYIQLSTERIKYKTGSGMDTKSILTKLMERTDDEAIAAMEDAIRSTHQVATDYKSLYERNATERDIDGNREGITLHIRTAGLDNAFIEDMRSQISTEEIDRYALTSIGEREEITTKDFPVTTIDEFVLFLLSTVRACEKDSPFIMENCESRNCMLAHGVKLPMLRARRRHGIQRRI